jgi:hypothetical protein
MGCFWAGEPTLTYECSSKTIHHVAYHEAFTARGAARPATSGAKTRGLGQTSFLRKYLRLAKQMSILWAGEPTTARILTPSRKGVKNLVSVSTFGTDL